MNNIRSELKTKVYNQVRNSTQIRDHIWIQVSREIQLQVIHRVNAQVSNQIYMQLEEDLL